MADEFTLAIIEIIKSIPAGKVSSYGRIARMAGNPRGARQVVRILHTCSDKYNLPWHRVVDRLGRIPPRSSMHDEFQKSLLIDEGVTVDRGNRVDLQEYLWDNE